MIAACRARSVLSATPTPFRQIRSLWQCSTVISPSPSSIVSHLEQARPPTPPALTLFAISKNVPQDLVQPLRTALASSSPAVGCLTEVLPPSAIAVLSPDLDASVEHYSISIARYLPSSPSERGIPFRSALTGRPNISLGREHKPEQETDGIDAGFEAFLRGEKWGFGDGVNLHNGRRAEIEELKGVDPSQVKEIVCFTADRIQPFLGALSAFPRSATAGLVGTSTPFHSPTHAPFSLFFDSQTSSTGAVGIAVVDSAASRSGHAAVDYGGLEPLGDVMQVTSSRGNIVLTLSEQNAARLLLNAVQALPGPEGPNRSPVQRSEEKEKEFYAAVFDHEPQLPLDLGKVRHVSKIMAGDPSRGAMSVETEEEVKIGYHLVFLHRPASATVAPRFSLASPRAFTFLATAPSHVPPRFSAADAPTKGAAIVIDSFVAASENGILVSPGGGGENTVCAIDGASVSLQ
ncbi:hypothetical protein JCM1841_000080 [Sporobolomyces salmonicolor]